MKPVRETRTSKAKGQTAKPAKKDFFKETAVLTKFVHGYVRDSRCSGLLTCKGTLWNQSATMKTLKDASETLKTEEEKKLSKKHYFQMRLQS